MKSKILISLAILFVCVSATAFITDAHTNAVFGKNTDDIKENKGDEEDDANLTDGSLPKSKLTLAILFLGGVGLAVFRRNSFL